MRTFIAVIAGLVLTGALVSFGAMSFAALPGADHGSGSGPFTALAWTLIAICLGAVLTVRVQRTAQAVAGFIVGELFFGVGLLHEFWHAPTWYSALAILMVIPGALLGYWIALQLHADLKQSA